MLHSDNSYTQDFDYEFFHLKYSHDGNTSKKNEWEKNYELENQFQQLIQQEVMQREDRSINTPNKDINMNDKGSMHKVDNSIDNG